MRADDDATLAGARCILRRLRADDAESVVRHANDREIRRNVRDRFPFPYTIDDAGSWIAQSASEEPVLTFGIDVDGDVAGSVGLVPGRDIERTSAEIGYWVGAAHRGRGVATEAVRLATAHAFARLGVVRVFAVPFARNAASCRVLERAGYRLEGTMRRSAIKDGELLDQRLYAAYADDPPGTGRSAPPGDVEVRVATPEDVPALVPLVCESLSFHAAALPRLFRPEGDAPVDARALGAALALPGHCWLVARRGGRVVGYASVEERHEAATPYERASDLLHLHAMAVTARERRRGVGRALMAAVRAEAAGRGLGALSLEVYAFDHRARAFYEREGFEALRALLVSRPTGAP